MERALDDIGAAAKAAVQQPPALRADYFDDFRQCVDRGAAAVVDGAAVVQDYVVQDYNVINERGDVP
jgi:hypothetical protein